MNIIAGESRESFIEWTLNDEGVLEIRGFGYMDSYSDELKGCTPPWAGYSSYIKKVDIRERI